MTSGLGRIVRLPHSLRLTIVCLALAGLLSGVIFLGGATIVQQATALSNTIKSQLVNVKAFLDKNGIDTSYFELGNANATPSDSSKLPSDSAAPTTAPTTPARCRRHIIPPAAPWPSTAAPLSRRPSNW